MPRTISRTIVKRFLLCYNTSLILNLYSQVARAVWKWDGNVEVSMKPLGVGKNFLSDAYFATVTNCDSRNGEQSRKVFIKVDIKSFYYLGSKFIQIP